MPTQDFPKLFETYQANMYPAMFDSLSEELNISVPTLQLLGVGYFPLWEAWVLPERDDKGIITGLLCRFRNGTKQTIKGSKRGLIYALNDSPQERSQYIPGKQNWTRVSKQFPCPLCGKHDGCLFPSDINNPADASAVVCVHISQGAVKPLKLGYLHVLKPQGKKYGTSNELILASALPIIIIEGFTDTGTAMDLGFTAIGRPSAQAGMNLLPSLVKGKDVIIVGDNDAGAGLQGLESTFQTLQPICKSVIKVLPPESIKDLRDWRKKHNLTQKMFLDYVKQEGQSVGAANLLPSDVAYNIADFYLQTHKTEDGSLVLRNYKGQWVQYDAGKYSNYEESNLRGEIYRFLDNKNFPKVGGQGTTAVVPFKPSRAKISDVVDAFNAWCPISKDPPLWLVENKKLNPKNLIVFKNGMLDIEEYINTGEANLYPLTPEFFTFNMLPYDYDPDAESMLFKNFCSDIFSNDQDKILLLAQWFGYNLIPDMSMEKLMLFIGRPRSGKSTMLETMSYMLGQEQCCSTSFQSLCGPFGFQPLIGKLAALVGDAKVPHAREADAALEKILQITGGDPVTINRKRIKQLSLVNLTCRFTIVANDLPAFTDHARALEPRMNILDFENSYIGKEDRTLKSRLKVEAQTGKIINFALRGLRSLREQRIFVAPKSSTKILKSFVELTSPVTEFLSDCCTTDATVSPGQFTTKDELYEAWRHWCEEQGRKPGLKQQFGRWLLSACPKIETDRIMIQSRRMYIFRGIKLQDWVVSQYLERP